MLGELGTTSLAAFQSSLSVLLTLSYGLLAAHLRYLDSKTTHHLSQLCINVFLPALYVVQIGPELSVDHLKSLGPLALWGFVIVNIGALLGWVGSWKHPKGHGSNWIIACSGSNNGNAMPFLMLSALGTTSALEKIIRPDETISQAVERGKGYVLVYALVQQTWTLAVIPALLRWDKEKQNKSNDGVDDNIEENSERTPLLQQQGHVYSHASPSSEPSNKLPFQLSHTRVASLKEVSMHFYRKISPLLTPPLISLPVTIFLGLVRPLHELLLDENSSPLYPSLTSSLKNIGELFTSLQMVVLGGQLYASWKGEQMEALEERKSYLGFAIGYIVLIRFAVIPVISIASLYGMVKLGWLPYDPMLWFIMALVPCGPTALTVGAIAELEESDKDEISACLVVSYIISPLIAVSVTGALRTVEALQ